jgi:hypothetical protein
MKTPKLTIVVPHEKAGVPAESLVIAVQDTIRLLQDLQRNKGAEVRQWNIVAITMHSPLTFTIAPDRPGGSVVRDFLTGMRDIERSSRKPQRFTIAGLAIARKLTAVVSNNGGQMRFSSGRRSVTVTRKASEHLQAIQSRRSGFSATAELDGRLETVSVHGEQYFCIYDRLTNEPVRCGFDESQLVRVSQLLTQRARVRVTGMVRYNKAGMPVHVNVSAYEPLPEQKDLPQIADVHKAGVNIMQGMDSVEYIRKMRNGK